MNPLVSISCITYNQASYIKQCLDGFLCQKTNFEYEVLVHDDASTDGTTAIIEDYEKRYPQIIKLYIQKKNQYSQGKGFVGLRINAERAKGKYLAFCEGDDYWNDPFKLQKQIDFLEKNEDFVLSHTCYNIHYESNSETHKAEDIYNKNKSVEKSFVSTDLLTFKYRILTVTVVTRTKFYLKVINDDPFLYSGYFLMGDTQAWYDLSKLGKIHYLKDFTSVYRIINGSATRSLNVKRKLRFFLSSSEMRLYIAKRDNLINLYQDFRKVYDERLIKCLSFDRKLQTIEALNFCNVRTLYKILFKLRLLKPYIILRKLYY